MISDVAPRERKAKSRLDEEWTAPQKRQKKVTKPYVEQAPAGFDYSDLSTEEFCKKFNQCQHNALCVRGYKHNGRGGHCLLSTSKEGKARPPNPPPPPPRIDSRQPAKSQCDRNPLCIRGYKHMGQGGHCNIVRDEAARPVSYTHLTLPTKA